MQVAKARCSAFVEALDRNGEGKSRALRDLEMGVDDGSWSVVEQLSLRYRDMKSLRYLGCVLLLSLFQYLRRVLYW